MDSDLKLTTFKNISFNVIGKTIALIFSTFSNIILSRTLSAGDYGIAGFANIIINFLILFNGLGINSAIIQRRILDERQLYTAFSIKVVLGIFLTVICFIISPFVPLFFENNEKVINVLRLLSLTFIINIFYFLPSSILTRELNYRNLSLINLCSSITGSLIAIALALLGFKYWTIVFSTLSADIVLAVFANLIKPIKIKLFYFEKEFAIEFIRYGGPLFVSLLISFAIFNADNFIIGMASGSNALGFYMIGYNWGSNVCTLISGLVLTVFFPTFSRIQTEKEQIKNIYLKILEYISFFGILANITLFIVSKEFLVYVLGHGTEKWLPALTTLRILCIYGITRVLLEPVCNVIMAIGETWLIVRANILTTLLELPLIYPALKYFGIEGVAVVVTGSYIAQYFVYFPFLKKKLNIQLSEAIKSVRPAVLSCFIIFPLYYLNKYMPLKSTLFFFVKEFGVSVLCYILTYGFITKWKIFRDAKNIFNSMYKV